MSRRIFCKLFLIVVAVVVVLFFSGVLQAQGRRAEAFARVRQVQQIHTARLMAIKGIEGTAIGLNQNDQPALQVFAARPGVGGIPNILEGVPVRVIVTGKFYALPKGGNGGGKPGGNDGGKQPKAPTGLTATARGEPLMIVMDWNDNKGRVDHYNVYRLDVSIDEAIGWSVDASYSDGSVQPSTPYSYVVTVMDKDGNESGYSNEASATTPAGGGDMAPTNLTATAVSSSEIGLNWDDNGEGDLSHYRVYRFDAAFFDYVPIADNVVSNAYSDAGLAAETTYLYVVKAVDTSGNESGRSNEAWATTDAASVEHPSFWWERPVPIGVSTGHPLITAGTIGCRVYDDLNDDKVRNEDEPVYALSNNHIYANENDAIKGDDGDHVIQPGTYDGGLSDADDIGTLDDFQVIDFNGGNNRIDAAIALSSLQNLGNATPAGSYGIPKSTPYPADADYFNLMNLMVQKHGRTTGLTHGVVYSVLATINVDYASPGEDPKIAIFVDQIMIMEQNLGYFSQGGDSGSLVVTYPGRQPVGLLFAGGSLFGVIPVTVANPIDLVLDHFGVTVDGE